MSVLRTVVETVLVQRNDVGTKMGRACQGVLTGMKGGDVNQVMTGSITNILKMAAIML